MGTRERRKHAPSLLSGYGWVKLLVQQIEMEPLTYARLNAVFLTTLMKYCKIRSTSINNVMYCQLESTSLNNVLCYRKH